MARTLHRLPAREADSACWNVVIDTPKGSRNKYKYDEDIGLFRLSKVLPLGASFPFDFGFIPSTKGEDGDALDVLLLAEEAAFVGCVAPARLIGVIEAEQREKDEVTRNDRLIAVVETPFNEPVYRSLQDVGEQRLAEIEHFFISYNAMEGRQFRVLGRRGPAHAEKLVEQASVEQSPRGKRAG